MEFNRQLYKSKGKANIGNIFWTWLILNLLPIIMEAFIFVPFFSYLMSVGVGGYGYGEPENIGSVVSGFSGSALLYFLTIIVGIVASYLVFNLYLTASREDRKISIGEAFKSFSWSGFWSYFIKYIVKNLWVSFIVGVVGFILGLIFGISLGADSVGTIGFVGVIVYIAYCIFAIWIDITYSLTNYYSVDRPDLGVIETLKASRAHTKGHIWNIFVFHLSFILWYLLVGITFGIAALYVAPYTGLSETEMYLALSGEE